MRISDWSSDVCSSDLMHRVRCEVPGEDPARRRGIDGSRVSACVQPSALIALGTGPQTKAIEANEALGVLLVVRAAIVLERRQRRVEQIGRASCRERVCQYVWSPVDDRSLNKKKK